ncbi:hypothetical protein [Variovorax sp. J31P207]|uniref:hypothetical protein n=1 Tax=Variovorax sp. J31P207 TaxID=3053510 RepID=UPI002575B765|nr:hypothetical protein [Variovorax sp. J31P207]MDM0072013.1 hypothetical protein [Variovorax sp. J31P207]
MTAPTSTPTSSRPLKELNYLEPQTLRFLTAPQLVARMNQAIRQGQITPAAADILYRDLTQHMRAQNGDRTRPGLYDPTLHDDPGHPRPFAPKEQYRPDRAPGTAMAPIFDQAADNLRNEALLDGLQKQIGTDASLSVVEPISLRDQVEAA